eukprot:NODE_1864_length_1273_cov_3.310458_g1544_i0.p1 GENE.NODE_1864_length_1273_cov_3.310458_g1544_i0~~NODE_1864_length_1273_cov_3.310458_g1544_i0.p1  ORF type:complete len:121 (+),score=15.09 NODE_1864_length_1273_cov_3.310458_g1544_i0:381-743(+)
MQNIGILFFFFFFGWRFIEGGGTGTSLAPSPREAKASCSPASWPGGAKQASGQGLRPLRDIAACVCMQRKSWLTHRLSFVGRLAREQAREPTSFAEARGSQLLLACTRRRQCRQRPKALA